jgi:dihydroxy-acid dehydratase
MTKDIRPLRSTLWYDTNTRMGHTHRQRTSQAGFGREDYRGKPVIGILNTWSEMNPCHIHFRERAEHVKRGVWQAGGFPVEIPVMSGLYRNMLAMEVEEVIRCHPLDGVVLMGGCDKTTPAMIMGATTMNLPTIFMPAGPMLTGRWRGQTLGSGTDTSRLFAELKGGTISQEDFDDMEEAGARSAGHCMTMGTASTMTSMAEVLGLTFPGAAAIPAPDSRHVHLAARVGRRIVEMVPEDLKPCDILTNAAFRNAVATLMALGGSTNAVIHLIAMAGRAGRDLTLADFDAPVADVPVLANIRPVGDYLMEDFFYAGGLPALLFEISEHLDHDAMNIEKRRLGDIIGSAQRIGDEVIRPKSNPVSERAGLVVLRGNLAPGGAILKRAAASDHLLQHEGTAIVFDGLADMTARIDDPALGATPDSVLILRGVGPVGGPGMPEWGMLPIPKPLLEKGVRDMVRISDARMSGTQFGTVILHTTPEAARGGPLALVQTGDRVRLDVAGRTLDILADAKTLSHRQAAMEASFSPPERGWAAISARHIMSASEGMDLDVLVGQDDGREPEMN